MADIPKLGQEIPMNKERAKDWSNINNIKDYIKFKKKYESKI